MRTRDRVATLVLGLALALAPRPSAARLIVVISDLHLGLGYSSPDVWDKYEDFRWANEFDLFLTAMSNEGQGATTLVINGDAFELWQSRTIACKYQEDDHGCTEDDALARLDAVLAAHPDEVKSLVTFANGGDNRVVFIPGNHDAALLLPKLTARLATALGANQGRISVSDRGHLLLLSTEGDVLIEHGHEIGKDANRIEGWPDKPYIDAGGVRYLRRSWGEQMVQEFYNQIEDLYPIIDNISEEGAAIRYGLGAAKTPEIVTSVGRLLRFVVLRQSWAQLAGALGDEQKYEEGDWDLVAIRSQGPWFLVDSLAADDPLKQPAEEALRRGILEAPPMLDAEIIEVCDGRAALKKAQIVAGKDPTIHDCPGRQKGSMGALYESLTRERDEILEAHLEKRKTELASAQPFAVFIYGHTHRVENFWPVGGTQVVNEGAWQRVITPKQLEAKKGGPEEFVKTASPEDIEPGCYSLVMFEEAKPSEARLRYWVEVDGQWQTSGSCD